MKKCGCRSHLMCVRETAHAAGVDIDAIVCSSCEGGPTYTVIDGSDEDLTTHIQKKTSSTRGCSSSTVNDGTGGVSAAEHDQVARAAASCDELVPACRTSCCRRCRA